MEDWPEDSPQLDPDFKPVRKDFKLTFMYLFNTLSLLISFPLVWHNWSNIHQCPLCNISKTFQLIHVFFSSFFKSGKYRLRRESLRVKDSSVFLFFLLAQFIVSREK